MSTRDYGRRLHVLDGARLRRVFETDHGSGQWVHPSGGPYVFIAESSGPTLEMHPVLKVADAESFDPAGVLDYVESFTAQHWGAAQAIVRDPDGRHVSLQAPTPT